MFPYLLAANPADAFRVYNMGALDLGAAGTGLSATAESLPFPPEVALASLAAWIVVALSAATAVFRRIEP